MVEVMGECRNESAVAGGIGDSGDEERGVEEEEDMGEGAWVFGMRIPNPSVLRLCEPTVIGVSGQRFYDGLANNAR